VVRHQLNRRGAALVEQASSAAHAMSHEASELLRLIERYHVGGGPPPADDERPAAFAPPAKRMANASQ